MSITSSAIKSSKLLRSLKPLNPHHQCCFLHLATEKSSSLLLPSTITKIVDILKSNCKESWKSIDHLALSLPSLSSHNYLQIARRLGTSSIALHFVVHLRENSYCPDEKSLSFVFQAAFELASRENDYGDKLLELYEKSKEFNVSLSVNSATHLIKCFSRAKMIDKLMMVYENLDAQMKNIHVRNLLIDVLLNCGKLDDTLQVLDEMLQPNSEFPPNENTVSIIYQAVFSFEMSGSEEQLVEMVSTFGSRGLFPDSISLTKWIGVFCQCKKVNMAWELVHAIMKLGGPVQVESCNALLTGLGKAREFKKMNLLMKEMQEKGICPDVVTLGISINHLCKSMRLDEAVDLFERMRRGEVSAGIEPDVIIHNTLIDGLCKAGRVEDGLAIMRKMGSESRCAPSTATYNCLIDGFCKAGEMEKSLELFDEMKKAGIEPDIITVNIMVNGYCTHGKSGTALKFYREMQEMGLDGNKKTYTSLISGFCGVNNIRKAMELLDEMRENCKPDAIVYYTLISGLSQAGLMDEVESILSEMSRAGFAPDIGCYNVMIHGFCQKNRLDKAHVLLRQMVDDGVKPDSFTYNSLISYFSKTGDLKTAQALLKQMLNDKVVPTVVTYGALIHACCSAGEHDEAIKILRQMSLSSRVSANTVIYNTLIDSLCRSKRAKLALSLFDDMLAKDVRPNTNTFNALLKAMHEEDRLDKAFELMDKMIMHSCNPDYITLEVLTQWMSAAGAAERLRQFVKAFAESA